MQKPPLPEWAALLALVSFLFGYAMIGYFLILFLKTKRKLVLRITGVVFAIPLATIAAIILDAGAAWLCGLSFHLRGGSEPFGPVLYLIPIAAPTFAILAVILLFVVFPKE